MGIIGVSLTLNWNPRFFNSRLNIFVLAHSFFTSFSPSGESSSANAAWHAAAVAGGGGVEKKKGPAPQKKKTNRARQPQTHPPPQPNDFLYFRGRPLLFFTSHPPT